MKINDTADSIVELLKADENLNDVKIFKAYPNRKLCEDEDGVLVCVDIKLEANEYQAGQSDKEGNVSTVCSLYAPISIGAHQLINVASIICNDIFDGNTQSVSVSRVSFDEDTRMYKLVLTLSFYDNIIFE